MQNKQAIDNNIHVQFVFGKQFDSETIKKDGGDLSDPRWSCYSMFRNNPGYIFRAYSCAYGHREILQRFIASEHTHALILEDDVLYPPNIIQVAERLTLDYPEQHYFNLNSESFRKKIMVPTVQDINSMQVIYQNQASGLGMYLVDRFFAQYALENMLNPLHLPADVVVWSEWSPIQKIAVVYGTGVATSEENLNSIIGYGIQGKASC